MSIEIRNLCKHFPAADGRKEVLKGLDLNVRPGELLALHGANGAGKTTLLKILATMVLPSDGKASVAGFDIISSPESVRARTALVCDTEKSFYQMLSLRENFRFYARLFGVQERLSEERIAAFSSELGIVPWLEEKACHCSSGIRQRAALARAMLTAPSVLLVDELTRSLDAASADTVSFFLKQWTQNNKSTCLIVTHHHQWAQRFADRITLLENGRIKE